MEIKLKNVELVSARNGLMTLTTLGLPAKASILLDNILEELDDRILELKKARLKLIEEHGDLSTNLLQELWMNDIVLDAKPIPVDCLNDTSLTLVTARRLRRFVVI